MTKDELITKKVSAISLGCDKNRTDLEHMLYGLSQFGFEITANLEDAEIIIVNTCAFIQSAIEEAIANIEYALSLKTNGKAEKVIVSGCLPMREKEEIINVYPNVDSFITLADNPQIVGVIESLYDMPVSNFKFSTSGRIITNQGGYAYLKIAEGCSNGCAYCTIPRIRGRFRSIPEKEILEEANALVKKGYKELILVAQDTARYGEDLFGKPSLLNLLQELVKIKGLSWIKLQYIYPEWVSLELLDFIANNPKMCKYLDMPLQHIDNKILKDMNRKTDEDETRKLIKLIRGTFPEIVLRSTFIVGFPGETKQAYQKLYDFISYGDIRYASFFAFSKEEKTKAYYMPKQVWGFVKKKRLNKIETLQNIVLNNINQSRLNEEVEVMIDGFDGEMGLFWGHEKNASPDIDLKVTFDFSENCQLEIGKIYKAKLVELNEFGFKGEIL